jgi:hypothetical protein
VSDKLIFAGLIISWNKEVFNQLIFRLKKADTHKNNETNILRYSFSSFWPKMLTMRLRFYAININPTSALARFIPFLVPAIKGGCVTRRSHPGTDPGTLAGKLSRCKEGTAQFLPSWYNFYCVQVRSRYNVTKWPGIYPVR